MEMQDMKMSDEEAKEESSPEMEAPLYPYGLSITLNEEAIAKLGLKQLPQIGQTMLMQARVEVKAVSAYQSRDGEQEQSLTLQITDLGLGPDFEEQEDPSELLYNSDGSIQS